MNILLALRQRDLSGAGCHLDIAMADAMFTFAWHAMASAVKAGPRAGEGLLTGGSPATTFTVRGMASWWPAQPWNQNSGQAFLRRDRSGRSAGKRLLDPAATREAVAKLISSRTARTGGRAGGPDCCANDRRVA